MYVPALETYRLAGSKAEVFLERFKLMQGGLSLKSPSDVKRMIGKIACVYAWIMRRDNDMFTIYVGQTASLRERVSCYSRAFQPRSPDDYKLLVFEELMLERFQGAVLDLYFETIDCTDLTDKERKARLHAAENRAITDFKSLLYALDHEPEAQKAFEKAFIDYYRSGIRNKFEE